MLLRGITLSKKRIVSLFAVSVAVILFLQLLAMTAWTADDANRGPSIAIVQLSDDPDSDWAVSDIQTRLGEFVSDDAFIRDRVVVKKTSDPTLIERLDEDIIIYVTHGGPVGMVTGNYVTSWKQMADIVSRSSASIHLFTTCYSKRIVKYGDSDSGKNLYTVPEARPAEVSDVEVVSTVMLALGISSSDVETYRTQELTKAKCYIESGGEVHIMDFNEIIIDSISDVESSNPSTHPPEDPLYYEDQYTIQYLVENYYTLDGDYGGLNGYYAQPARIWTLIDYYFRAYTLFDGTSGMRDLESLELSCVESWYYTATYYTEIPEIPLLDSVHFSQKSIGQDTMISPFYTEAMYYTGGHWENSTPALISADYNGTILLSGINTPYRQIDLQVIASADETDTIKHVFLNQTCEGGLYVDTTYPSVLPESITGRNMGRSGSVYIDPLLPTDYEYKSGWPGHPYINGWNTDGELQSIDDYLTIVSIPEQQGWHGPSFVKTLQSPFRLQDLTTFSVNMSLLHGGNDDRVTSTLIGLYDADRRPALVLNILDSYNSGSSQTVRAIYYREDGSCLEVSSDTLYGDFQGVLTMTYDSVSGLYAILPEEYRTYICNPYEISWNRVIKYLTIESCRYYEDPEHDVRIYSINIETTHSESAIYYENCQTSSNFFNSTTLSWGTLSPGIIETPTGESYITPTWIESGSGWHGPNYVQVLSRPFRLSQLSDFSIESEIFLELNEVGMIEVGLFDGSEQCIMMFTWGGLCTMYGGEYYFNTYYHPEGGTTVSQATGFDGSHESWTARMWYEDGPSGGVLFSQVNNQIISQPWDVANDSRVAKYIAIIPSRHGSLQLPDMRIHDIQLVATIDSSQHTVAFVENCRNADGNPDLDNFYSLPGFDGGDFSDGNLLTHSSGYIYPSIPTGSSGWHGPNFVHILEQSFPLSSLTDFMVTGEYDQSYSMGKMSVSLYDENYNLVMNIYWGDSWIGTTKGYHHVVFYPENGGSHADTTGYIYTEFTRTGRMWYEDGHIKYEIEGIESGDFGPVDNPNRMIKYVVIRPSRSGSYIFGDLRIHGITVTTDYRPAEAYLSFIDDCTDPDNFTKNLNFDWGEITDGDLITASGTSYITTSNMDDGAYLWHGPNFLYNLSIGLPLKNLFNFTVTGEIVQSSSSMGKMYVALFDENMKCAMLIYWGDAWVGSEKGYHHVVFYPEDGGSYFDSTGYIYTSFLRTAKMWYEDGAIKYEIEGIESGTLAAVDNPDRLIKYIVVRPMKYYHYTVVDLRIHDIILQSDCALYQDPGYGFIEDCKNAYNLPKDLSFGWGEITDGDLSSPSNRDYLTPSNMATGPIDWHGPNFVHVLEQPLRLFELSDFAVTGELCQSSFTLGKMDVALFDENKQIVMNIYWGDSWHDYQKAYHHVKYHPESGGSYADTTDYIYDTSFLWTGRMWFEDGYIKYEIEGGESGILAAVDNPNRLIKYVVVRPSKSWILPMVDLRIHQISVTSGFRTPTQQSEVFPAPVQTTEETGNDGTLEGLVEEAEPNPEVQSWFDTALAVIDAILTWWAGIWPRLHLSATYSTISGGIVTLHFSIDILGDLQMEEGEYNSPYFNQLTETDADSWAQHVSQQAGESGDAEDLFRWATNLSILFIKTGCAALPAAFIISGVLGVAAVLITISVAWTAWLFSLVIGMGAGVISLDFVLGLLTAWLASFMTLDGLIYLLAGHFFLSAFMYMIVTLRTATKGMDYFWTWLKWSILGAFVQFFMCIITFHLFTTLFDNSLQEYFGSAIT